MGVNTQVVELFLDIRDPAASAVALEQFRLHAGFCLPSVVVVSDVFDPALFQAIRGSCGATVICTDGMDTPPPGAVDYLVDRFETNPVPLVRLAAALVRGLAVYDIPNIRVPGSPADPVAETCAQAPMFTATPDYAFFQVPWDVPRPSNRLSVYVNPGCPWTGSAADNPEFAGADLSGPGLALRGCSFCLQDGRYSGLDAVGTVDRIALELECWLKRHPDCRDLVIWDESPWRFLPALVDRIASISPVPMAICFHARADDLIRNAARIEESCAVARRHPDSGVTLAVTLIGFENYSARELARMNKGSSAEDVSGSVATCRRIADAFPEVFEFDRFKASSFILFTPWTTREDLEANIDGFNRDNMLEFSTGMALTKLRLYPGLPISRLAVRDGLVSDGTFDDGMNSSRRFGYSTDIPWRFADHSVERVYRLYDALYPLLDRHEQIDLLDWVVRAVFDGDGASMPADSIADLFGRLVSSVRTLNARGRRPGRNDGDAGKAHRSGTLEVTLSGSGVPGPGRRPDLSCDPSPGRLAVRIARYGGQASMIHVIGREPGRSPVFLRAVYLARQSGIPRATVRTDGLVFEEPVALAKAIKAGVTDVEFRVFGAVSDRWTMVTGDPRGFDRFRKAASLVGASASVIRSRALIELGMVLPREIREVAGMLNETGLAGMSFEAPVVYLPVSGLADFVDSLEESVRTFVNPEPGRP